MSTSLPLTKWPPNFRLMNVLFFPVNDVSSSTTKPAIFIHASTLHFGFRISIFYFSDGKIAVPMNHMKSANVPIPVGFMKVTGIYLA